LLEWLDDGVESHGERYLEMRRRLVSYFDRRDRTAADELADETFNRIARTLEHTGEIATRPPARYCYVAMGAGRRSSEGASWPSDWASR
jgi:hypothetical protein